MGGTGQALCRGVSEGWGARPGAVGGGHRSARASTAPSSARPAGQRGASATTEPRPPTLRAEASRCRLRRRLGRRRCRAAMQKRAAAPAAAAAAAYAPHAANTTRSTHVARPFIFLGAGLTRRASAGCRN